MWGRAEGQTLLDNPQTLLGRDALGTLGDIGYGLPMLVDDVVWRLDAVELVELSGAWPWPGSLRTIPRWRSGLTDPDDTPDGTRSGSLPRYSLPRASTSAHKHPLPLHLVVG